VISWCIAPATRVSLYCAYRLSSSVASDGRAGRSARLKAGLQSTVRLPLPSLRTVAANAWENPSFQASVGFVG
jgi:hypothetical protein